MTDEVPIKGRSPGRPREFDMGQVLDGAVTVFRERGYHAASLNELGAAMKLTPGSIYKAFDDKQALFLAAFEHYAEQRNAELGRRVEAERRSIDKLRAVLLFYAESAHGVEGRRGCLVLGAATEIGTFAPDIADRTRSALRRIEEMINDLILGGQADGSISPAINAETCAYLLFCTVQGFRVAGKAGRSQPDAVAAVDEAMRLIA